jgi:hypothetical protein
MLFKPSSNLQPFRVSPRAVAQADIIITICDELGIPINRQYSESLLREDEDPLRIRRHFHSTTIAPSIIGYLAELREFLVTGRIESFCSILPTFEYLTPGLKKVAPRLGIGSIIQFTKNGNYSLYTGLSGWCFPKDNLVWSSGKMATLYLPIKETGQKIIISMRCQPFIAPPFVTDQTLKVIGCNGKLLFDGKLTAPTTVMFSVPSEAFIGDILPIQFQFPNAVSPASLGMSKNGNALAIGFESLTIEGSL